MKISWSFIATDNKQKASGNNPREGGACLSLNQLTISVGLAHTKWCTTSHYLEKLEFLNELRG